MANPNAHKRFTKKGIAFVKHFEGEGHLTAYWDDIGDVWTIGYGHTKGVYKGQKITQAQADQLLVEDLKSYGQHVKNAVKVKLETHEYETLTSMCMNLGPGDLLYEPRSTLLRYLNAGNKAAVPEQILRWDKGGSPPRPVPGLTRRRRSEADLWKNKDYSPKKKV